MTRRIAIFATIAAVTCSMLAAAPARAAGIAIVPARITIPDALRGGEAQRALTLASDLDADRTLEARVEGDAAPWLTLVVPGGAPFETRVLAAGEDIDVVLLASVPADLPNGTYTAEVQFLLTPVEHTPGVVDVEVGAVVPVTIDVTGDQRLEGAYLDLTAGSTEVGLPMRVGALISNTGNVTVVPLLDVEIDDGTEVVHAELFSGEPVRPGQQTVINYTWDTTNERPGPYTVSVGVDFGGLDLGIREAAIELAPRGTLTRTGEIRSMELIGDAIPGGVARVAVVFANTGQIEARAVFAGEITVDGVLRDVVQSLERLVLAGQNETIEVFVPVPDPGTYTLTGKVNFEGTETAEQSLTFEVVEIGGGDGAPWALIGGAAGAGILLLAAGVFLVLRRRRRRPAPGSEEASAHETIVIGGGD